MILPRHRFLGDGLPITTKATIALGFGVVVDAEDLVHLESPLEIFLGVVSTMKLGHIVLELSIEFFIIAVGAARRSIIIIMSFITPWRR